MSDAKDEVVVGVYQARAIEVVVTKQYFDARDDQAEGEDRKKCTATVSQQGHSHAWKCWNRQHQKLVRLKQLRCE